MVEAGPLGQQADSPLVDASTQYGWDRKVTMAVPVATGPLGSARIVRENWEHFAVGAALAGITLVCGENVCENDPHLALGPNRAIAAAPEIDRRVEQYRRYHRGLGEILVEVSAEELRWGVAEYLIDRHGLETIELKWSQAASRIGRETRIRSLERALDLQRRGCVVTPDPSNPVIQAAFRGGVIREFARHCRQGFVDEESFLAECDRLRGLGYQRITLRTGALGLRELAMCLKWSSKARIDLVTIDGASGAADASIPPALDSPWAACQFAETLARNGHRVPDLALAGRFSTEEHVFRALALGAPYARAVCLGRALMIPGVVGKNVGRWIQGDRLPPSVSQYGNTPEEIFFCWDAVAGIVGKKEMHRIPLGAVGIFSYVNKLGAGLQRLMAGAGCTRLASIRRAEFLDPPGDGGGVSTPLLQNAFREEVEAILAET